MAPPGRIKSRGVSLVAFLPILLGAAVFGGALAMAGEESGTADAAAPPVKGAVATVARPDEAAVVYRLAPDIRLELAGVGQTRLSALWEVRPLLLTLVFSRCYGVCSPLISTIRSVADDVGGAGETFDILVLSFDARDTVNEMHLMAEATGAAGRPGWRFAIASPGDIARLTEAIGFSFIWDEERQQFDHPATLVAISDEGRIVRLFTGGGITQARFREMVSEIRGDFVPIYPSGEERRFRCFQFTADGGIRPSWGFLLLIFPPATALLLTLLIFFLTRTVSKR